MSEQYYTVGVVAGVHGLRGELKVLSRTDFDKERFQKGSKLYLRSAGQSPIRELIVRSGRPHKQFWLVAFDGLMTIHDVENWRGLELCVHESQLQDLPEGTYYVHDLIGLPVVTDEGRLLGDLVEVLTPGANDVYVVRQDGQPDVLLPAIPECVLSVDLASKKMIVHLMPGLVDADDEPTPRTRKPSN